MVAITDSADLKLKGEVALITIDSPPVNALSFTMRQGLMAALQAAWAEPAAKAIVLMCAGRTFIAGADLKEIAQPEESPRAIEIIDAIEASPKPVIAAIHGTALGGGFEVALGCHYRIAVPTAKCGLPEVSLGLLPGAGGTQRLTRVVGPEKALEIITGGKPLSAQECLELGLIDELITEFEFHDDAITFARKVLSEGRPRRKLRDLEDKVTAARNNPALFTEFRAKHARRFRGFKAPENIVRAIEAAVYEPFDQGMQRESQLFLELLHSPESVAQRYAFFAERETNKIPDVGGHTPILPVNKVGVVGAGLMGSGIAMSFANAGLAVKLTDHSTEALERGLATIRQNYASNVRSGRIQESDAQKRVAQIKGVALPELNDCDLIIEAVFENMQVKQDVFRQLDGIAKANAILATNTSALDIDAIASVVQRPESVMGLHFFSPANIMRLIEVVRAEKTSKAVIATAMQLAKRLGKVGVLVRVAPGFVGNRMLYARQKQVDELLLEGASPWDIDRVLTDFGMPMGPYAMADLAGLDLPWQHDAPNEHLFAVMSAHGRKGQKTRAGFYDYDEHRRASRSPQTDRIVAEYRARRGRTPRTVTDEEILERTVFPMINEGARILEEGKALRASDIDMVWVHGYGWPVYRGGPMFYADQLGLRHVVDKLRSYRLPAPFQLSPLLERLAAEGKRFIQQ